jgi:tight adherence protein C
MVPFLASLGKRIRSTDAQEAAHVRRQLLKAGYRRPGAVPVYYGTRIIMAVLLPVAVMIVNGTAYRFIPPRFDMPVAVIAAVIGYILPSVILDLKKARRKRRIFEGLPDALDLMVVCVEAGMGLDSAIHRVSEEIALDNKVVSDEFKIVGLELRAGKARADALRNLAIRSDLEDINSLVSLLIQTDRFGTSIVQSLTVHSDSMRTKRFQMAEEQAAKLPVKMVFPLIVFIFPALFVVIVGPAIISIIRNLGPVF